MSDLHLVDLLTSKALDGLASDEDLAKLEQMLIENEAARSRHIHVMELEASLRGERQLEDLAERTMGRLRDIRSRRRTEEVMTRIRSLGTFETDEVPTPASSDASSDASRISSRRRRWAVVAGLAAGSVILFLSGLYLHRLMERRRQNEARSVKRVRNLEERLGRLMRDLEELKRRSDQKIRIFEETVSSVLSEQVKTSNEPKVDGARAVRDQKARLHAVLDEMRRLVAEKEAFLRKLELASSQEVREIRLMLDELSAKIRALNGLARLLPSTSKKMAHISRRPRKMMKSRAGSRKRAAQAFENAYPDK